MKILNDLQNNGPGVRVMIHPRISQDLYDDLKPYMDANKKSWSDVVQAALNVLREELKGATVLRPKKKKA